MIRKLFGGLAEVRRSVTSPAGQVAIAGLLLTTGARIVVDVLGEVVDELGTRRAFTGLHAQAIDALGERLARVEHTMTAHNLNPPDATQLPDDVDGWPVGKRVEVAVSGIRVEEPAEDLAEDLDGREL